MGISDRLKAARGALGLKQDELSAQSGVSYSAYQKYEIGRSAPGADAIEGFVRAGINANWLLTGEGPMLVADITPTPAGGGRPLKLNRGALAAILRGLLSVDRDPDRIADHLASIYEDAYNAGEITDTDVGDGGQATAA
jgi:transcriptional regulator with XRE-family HTH domain